MYLFKKMLSGVALAALLGVLSALPNAAIAAGNADAAPALTNGTVLVAGATGQTGRRVIKQLKETSFSVRAMTRNLAHAHEIMGEDHDWVVADVTDAASLARAMDGVDLVISTIGSRHADPTNSPETVDYGGVRNLVDAARTAGVKQFVLVSSGGVTSGPDSFLNKNFDNVLTWKFKGEEYLRNSGLSYTVVRPGGLRDSYDPGMGLLLTQGDLGFGGEITYEDMATVLIECLVNPDARNKTFEVLNLKMANPEIWAVQLRRLQAD